MNLERRTTGLELRAEGRRLSGTVMRYGDVSPTHRERFEPGSLRMAEAVHLDLFHDMERAVAWHPGGGLELTNGKDELRMAAALPPIPAANRALAEIRAGRATGLSVEFRADKERQAGGIRVIEAATLSGIGIVRSPSYQQSRVEARGRSGRTLRAAMPVDRPVACECAGPNCNRAQIMEAAMHEAFETAFTAGTRAVVGAYLENYGRPLASTTRGTLRGRIRGAGGYEVDIDLPDDDAGRALVSAWESTGLIVRPFLADVESTVIEGVQVIEKARLRALIVTATDAREGWPDPDMVATPDELASAAAPRRKRRVWL